MEVMLFGGALQLILRQVLTSNPRLGPVYLRKLDLAGTYMRLWLIMEDVLSVALLVSNKPPATRSWWGFTSPSP